MSEHFWNRKGFKSINATIVCGPSNKIYFVSSNAPGSMHDSFIFEGSQLYKLLNEHWSPNNYPFPDAMIMGDGAYKVQFALFEFIFKVLW